MNTVLAVDIGGTYIKWAIINDSYDIIESSRFETPRSYDELLDKINHLKIEHADINAISISIPAGYDHANDTAFAPNLTLLNGKSVLKDFKAKFNLEVLIENDGNLATLGEYHIIERCGIDNMILLTLGTGVGGGAIIKGELLSGFATSFEVGHIIAKDGGALCGCGRSGCLDEYGTIVGIQNIYKEVTGKRGIEPIEIAKQYDEGDIYAVETFDKYAEILAKAITDIANLFAPDKIKLGGGLSELSRCYFDNVVDKFNKAVFPLYRGRIKLEIAGLKNNAGLFGATVNYFNKLA